MKKEISKKALALSALMIFVITGTSYAQNVDVKTDETLNNNPSTISVDLNESFSNEGTVIADNSITVYGGSFYNAGTIKTGILDIYDKNPGSNPTG